MGDDFDLDRFAGFRQDRESLQGNAHLVENAADVDQQPTGFLARDLPPESPDHCEPLARDTHKARPCRQSGGCLRDSATARPDLDHLSRKAAVPEMTEGDRKSIGCVAGRVSSSQRAFDSRSHRCLARITDPGDGQFDRRRRIIEDRNPSRPRKGEQRAANLAEAQGARHTLAHKSSLESDDFGSPDVGDFRYAGDQSRQPRALIPSPRLDLAECEGAKISSLFFDYAKTRDS